MDFKAEGGRLAEIIEKLKKRVNIEKCAEEFAAIEKKMAASDFWDDNEKAKELSKKYNSLKNTIEEFSSIEKKVSDVNELIEINDSDMEKEIEEELISLRRQISPLELKYTLSGAYDKNNTYLFIHSGAGGTEAMDWSDMLLRMYLKWAEKKGYKTNIIYMQEGDEAGIKEAVIYIEGDYAYGFLKSEQGVHRLVRISPFDSNKRRHTSFAAVSLTPEHDEDINIDINEADLRIDTYRSTGAGGQHVNTTDSAVRITHNPTGIVVQCQNERSQHKNKDSAMKLLKAKLYELKQKELEEKKNEMAGAKNKIEWGSQIRSYTFCPYTLVKDTRTGAEMGNVQAVMDGEIDLFIESFLKSEYNK